VDVIAQHVQPVTKSILPTSSAVLQCHKNIVWDLGVSTFYIRRCLLC